GERRRQLRRPTNRRLLQFAWGTPGLRELERADYRTPGHESHSLTRTRALTRGFWHDHTRAHAPLITPLPPLPRRRPRDAGTGRRSPGHSDVAARLSIRATR